MFKRAESVMLILRRIRHMSWSITQYSREQLDTLTRYSQLAKRHILRPDVPECIRYEFLFYHNKITAEAYMRGCYVQE